MKNNQIRKFSVIIDGVRYDKTPLSGGSMHCWEECDLADQCDRVEDYYSGVKFSSLCEHIIGPCAVFKKSNKIFEE